MGIAPLKLFLILIVSVTMLAALPIHDTVKNSDLSALEKLNDLGLSLNSLDEGKSALSLALLLKRDTMVKKLIELGADLNVGTPSPLYIVLNEDNIEYLKLLLKHKAVLPHDLGISGRSLLYDLLLLRKYKSVVYLLNQGLSFKKSGPLSPFILAIHFAPTAVIETFIQKGASINQKDTYFDSPLETALRIKRHNIASLLIENGAKVDQSYIEICLNRHDKYGLKLLLDSGIKIKEHKLLLKAVEVQDLEMTQMLYNAGASLNYMNRHKVTPLIEAIRSRNSEMITWMMEQKLDETLNSGAIYEAIAQGNIVLVERLLDKGIGLKAQDRLKGSVLLFAFKKKEFGIVDKLLDYDVDLEVKDHFLETALFKAIKFGNADIFAKLLAKGAQWNMVNKRGTTPLMLSIKSANYKAFKQLLDAGEKIDVQGIILSVKRGLPNFFLKVITPYYLAQIKDEKGNSLLHLASQYDRMSLVRWMILAGADIEGRNDRLETPLHVAAKEGNQKSASMLLSFDANTSALDMNSFTPKELARKYDAVALYKWLDRYETEEKEAQAAAQQALEAAQGENNASSSL